MPKFGYIVVEGPHDVEFVCRLLSPYGLRRIQLEKDLDPIFGRLIPRTFPHGGDLLKRVPVPLFLQNNTHAIAIHSAVGDSRLVDTIHENSMMIDYRQFTGIGILLDSDREVPAIARYEAIRTAMSSRGYTLPVQPGTVASGPPKLGAYVLPDNKTTGNLEDLMIESAQVCYPHLLASAKRHVDAAKTDLTLANGDGEDLTKIPVVNKAIVGAIASVLRPGKAIQTSIQDNKWFRDDNLALGRVKAVQDFLRSLFEL